MEYGRSIQQAPSVKRVTLHVNHQANYITLRFDPYQSLRLQIGPNGTVSREDIYYAPPSLML